MKLKARKKKRRRDISILNKEFSQRFKESLLSIELKAERELQDKNGKILLVTSTISGEGKSTVALNMAYAAALHEKKVLFIDADCASRLTGAV